jgi:NADH dehydrogenase
MTAHTLRSKLLVPRSVEETFEFFARPENLGRITPDSMGFDLRSGDRDMRSGLEIEYRIKPVLGIPMTWRSRIENYDPPRSFEDIQTAGPYRSWRHRHSFSAVDGGTLVEDEVTYSLPVGLLGNLANKLVVRHELEWIFQYREQAISAILEPAGINEHPLTVGVAGATGFVGGAIAAELRRRGHKVVALSHSGSDSRGWLPDDVEMREVDVSNGDGLPDALHGVDALVIALAFKNLPIEAPRRGQTFEKVDAEGTERLATAAREAGVKRLLYMSGAGAAPYADRHWFRAKWRAETAIRATGIPYTILRPTWIYGPRDVSLNRFLGFARQLLSVPMTNFGRQLLAPVFIDDIGRLAADSLTDDAATNQIFEIGGPENLRMDTIIRRAEDVAGLHRPIIPGPTPLIKLAAAAVAWLPTPPLTPDAVDFINQPATVDNKPLLQRMPRRLTPLDEGLRTYLEPA